MNNKYKYTINGNDYEVTIEADTDNAATVSVNGEAYEITKHNLNAALNTTATSSGAQTTSSGAQATGASVTTGAVPAATTGSTSAVAGGKSTTAIAPLPGVIVSIQVKEGDTITKGQCLAVLEAMKMENNIEAEAPGVITKIHVKEGDSVLEGAPIVTLN